MTRRRWAIALGGAALLAVGSALLAGPRLLRALWGSCSSTECAYLAAPPAAGVALSLGLYLLLAWVAIRQLRAVRPSGPRVPTAPLLVVLALGAILRVDRLELAHFRQDQAVAAGLGARLVEEGQITLVGILSSVGVPQLPGHVYLLGLPALFGRDPLLLGVHAALLGMVAVALAALVGWRWFGAWTGLLAALVLAVGFWPVQCSREVWGQCLLPPVALLYLDALLLLAVGGLGWGLTAASFWVGVMTHLHLLSPAYLLALPVAGAFARRSLRAAEVARAAVVFAITLLPYAVWELTPNVRLRDLRHLLQVGSGESAGLDGTVLGYLGGLLGAAGAERLLHPHEALYEAAAAPWLALTWVGAGLGTLGLGVLAVRALRASCRRRPALVLLAALFLPLLPLVWHATPLHPHYAYATLPLLALVAAVGVQALWSAPGGRLGWGGGVARGAAVAAVLAYAAASVGVLGALNGLVGMVENDGYGVPAARTQAAGQAAARAWREASARGPIFVGGHRGEVQPLVYVLGGRTPWSVSVFDDCRQLPQAQAPGPVVVLLQDAESPTARRLLDGGAVTASWRLARLGASHFGLYVVDAAALSGTPIPPGEAGASSSCAGRV